MTQIICPKTKPKKIYVDEEFLMSKIAKRMITRNLSKTPKNGGKEFVQKPTKNKIKKKQKNIKYGIHDPCRRRKYRICTNARI
jgi:hypothetical protein